MSMYSVSPPIFLSTLSLRRATLAITSVLSAPKYFYPRSPCGERLIASRYATGIDRFLSTLSLRRATWQSNHSALPMRDFYPRSPCGERPSARLVRLESSNFYPRSPCGERLLVLAPASCCTSISIHALLAESDKGPDYLDRVMLIFLSTLSLRRATADYYIECGNATISIHALLAESDTQIIPISPGPTLFLSTLSLRRATITAQTPPEASWYFYPRSPCGERPSITRFPSGVAESFLSTLSLRRATFIQRTCFMLVQFLSTLSLRRATGNILPFFHYFLIFLSTLSLRRATQHLEGCHSTNKYFYPRSPCGERLQFTETLRTNFGFLSTLSLRRATLRGVDFGILFADFYPRSPCGERQPPAPSCKRCRNFYPRSPCGERRNSPALPCLSNAFLSTLSLRRATQKDPQFERNAAISIHALLAESDGHAVPGAVGEVISIHALLAESDSWFSSVHA